MAKYSTKGYHWLTKTELESLEEKLKDYDNLKIYTDGSSWVATGAGGYAVVFVDDENNEIHHIKGGFHKTTNNRMELFALLISGQVINYFIDKNIIVYSDSEYSINTLIGRFKGKANPDLLVMCKDLNWKVPYDRIKKVKGHSGDFGNDLADRYCGEARISIEEAIRVNKKTISEKELNERIAELEATIVELIKSKKELKQQIIEIGELDLEQQILIKNL